jgi:[ribosomal protein S18]-alanine N-acetyltransferase
VKQYELPSPSATHPSPPSGPRLPRTDECIFLLAASVSASPLEGDLVEFRVEPATPKLFLERAAWRYPPPFDFYNDDGVPPKNPERFYGVFTEDGAVAGFYYFEERGDVIFYGLGLRPDLTGRGLGAKFVKTGVEFAQARFGRRHIVLDVAEFNERAIRVYERAGFRRTGSHVRSCREWGELAFVDMELSD